MGPWASAGMARSILMEPRALPHIQDKETAARAGREIVTERVGPAPNVLPLTTSSRDEVVSEGSARALRDSSRSNPNAFNLTCDPAEVAQADASSAAYPPTFSRQRTPSHASHDSSHQLLAWHG
jgi:hypothetical protein